MPGLDGITSVDDIALPIEDVALDHLRTHDGAKVVVRCERINEVLLLEATEMMPGGAPDDAAGDALAQVRLVDRWAPALFRHGTALRGADGKEVRPAFYDGEVAPHPRSIPIRLLHEADKARLVVTLMRLGGYVGGAADEASFPVPDAGRGAGGTGTPAAGGDGAPAAAGGAV